MSRLLSAERLESRQLLAGDVTPTVTIDGSDISVLFDVSSGYNGDVYLRTNSSNGAVEWGLDGSTYEAFSETFTDKTSASFALSYDATADALSNFGFDLFSSLVIGNFSLPGVDTSFESLEIDVQAGATISTAKPVGSSGDLTFEAPLFATAAGASLITDHALSTDTPGDLTIEARGTLGVVTSLFGGTLPILPSTANTQAEVLLTDTTVRAGNVTIDATSDSADQYDDQDEQNDDNNGLQKVEGLSDFVGSVSLFVGFAISRADAEVTIDGGSIQSANLSASSTALSSAQTKVFSYKTGAAGLVISEPSAVINIQNGAVIESQWDVSLDSYAQSLASVSNLLRSKEKGGSIALGFTDITSQSTVSSDATIHAGGNFAATSDAIKEMNVNGTASGVQGAKTTFAINYSQSVADVMAAVDGNVTAAGDVRIESQLETTSNEVFAYSQTGFGGVVSAVTQKTQNSKVDLPKIKKFVSDFTGANEKKASDVGFSGSLSIAYQVNNTEARIGAGANVESTTGNIYVTANATELPKLASQAFTLNRGTATDGWVKSDTRDNSIALALTVGYVENNARAYIGDQAVVRAAGDLTVQSATHLPWEQRWWTIFSLQDVTNEILPTISGKLNYNLGIQDGFFTTWAEATAAGQKSAIGAQGNILVVDNSSEVWIGEGADVTVGGNATVVSTSENDSVNFAGQFLYYTGPPDSILTGSETTLDDGKGIGGSVLTVSYDNDTTANVRSSASLDAGSLLVMARSDSRNISIATQGGKSDGLSVSGAASALLVDDKTLARIDDGAFVTTRNGLVSIPRDYDEFDTSQNGLFSTIATFTPLETTDIDTTTRRVDVDTDTIDLPYAHGLETGDAVRYFNGGGENIGGLSSNQFYYVIKVDDTALQLSATPTGSAIDLDLDATSGTTHALLPGFTPADVDTADPTIIELGRPHNMVDGYQVVYQSGDGSASVRGSAPGATSSTVVAVMGIRKWAVPVATLGSRTIASPFSVSDSRSLVSSTRWTK